MLSKTHILAAQSYHAMLNNSGLPAGRSESAADPSRQGDRLAEGQPRSHGNTPEMANDSQALRIHQGAGIEQPLRSLHWLNLKHTGVTSAGAEQLRELLPSCQVIME